MIDFPNELKVVCDNCVVSSFMVPLVHFSGDTCGIEDGEINERLDEGWECTGTGTADGDIHRCPECIETVGSMEGVE